MISKFTLIVIWTQAASITPTGEVTDEEQQALWRAGIPAVLQPVGVGLIAPSFKGHEGQSVQEPGMCSWSTCLFNCFQFHIAGFIF